jgi:hypothetical protein
LEALRAPTFPHHHNGLNFPTEVCKRGSKDERTVTTACPQPCCYEWSSTTDELRRTDTRATHPGQENYSPPKGRIHLRRLIFSTKLFPCSRAADHTFVTVSGCADAGGSGVGAVRVDGEFCSGTACGFGESGGGAAGGVVGLRIWIDGSRRRRKRKSSQDL